MKKSLFSVLGTTVVALFLSLVLLSNPYSSKAADNLTTTNVAALTDVDPGGKCTGPKENGQCCCTNAQPCSDLSGCDSSVEN